MSLSLSWQDRVIIHTILTFGFDTPPPTIPYHQPSDPHKDLLKGHLHQESWSWSRTSSRVTCHCYASEEAQSSRDGFGEAQTAVLCIYTLALRIFTLLLAALAILSVCVWDSHCMASVWSAWPQLCAHHHTGGQPCIPMHAWGRPGVWGGGGGWRKGGSGTDSG